MIKVETKIILIGNKKVTEKIKRLFRKLDQNDKFSLAKTFYKNPKNDKIWLKENIGCECLSFTYDNNLKIISQDFVPIYFLSHLWNISSKIDPECIIEARFKSESNDPIGAFVLTDGIYAINDAEFEPDEDTEFIIKKIEELVDDCYDELNNQDCFDIKYRE